MRNLRKGKALLTHESDCWELAPKALVEHINNRKNIFHKFTFYENGIEFYYKSRKKSPLFIFYSDIECVYIISKDYFREYQKHGDLFPYWLVIDACGKRIRTYHSMSLPVDKIRTILIEKDCKIEKKIIDNYDRIYDYSIKEYLFTEDCFDIIFFDGRRIKYLWDNVVSISSMVDDPFKIKFDDDTELSLSHSEDRFIYEFIEHYNQKLNALEKKIDSNK
ncbi:MAG: hypothetical protein AB1779_10795 [Candidatus Thermoplasmatota archaeon]